MKLFKMGVEAAPVFSNRWSKAKEMVGLHNQFCAAVTEFGLVPTILKVQLEITITQQIKGGIKAAYELVKIKNREESKIYRSYEICTLGSRSRIPPSS